MLRKDEILKENQTLSKPSANQEVDASHRAALDRVETMSCSIKGQDLHLILLDSSGNGGGAAAFRELFILRKNRGLTGNFYVGSSGVNSTLFYLYMGMIPCEFDFEQSKRVPISEIYIPYIDSFFIDEQGRVDKDQSTVALKLLTAFINGENVSDENIIIIKMILNEERIRRNERTDSNYVTDEELKNNISLLLEIRDKKISELEGVFIPNLLKDFQGGIDKKEIDANRAGGVIEFKMTEEGFKRAHEAISKSEKIKPFKHLEHLPLTPAQRDELEKLIKQREELMAKNSPKKGAVMFSGNEFIKPKDEVKVNDNVTPKEGDAQIIKPK